MDSSYPEILSWYFRAVERSDLEVPGTCFTDDATVTDDGRTYPSLMSRSPRAKRNFRPMSSLDRPEPPYSICRLPQ